MSASDYLNRRGLVAAAIACSACLALLLATAASAQQRSQRADVAPAPQRPTAAISAYLKIPDIAGETRTQERDGEIELVSWSWGGAAAAPFVPGGAVVSSAVTGLGQMRSAAPPNDGPGALVIVKGVDAASPPLRAASRRGQRIPEVTLSLPSGNAGPDYHTVTLRDATITSVNVSGTGASATEEVTITYEAVLRPATRAR
jgi:type VI secretion system secreted protein Hcp